LTLAQSSRCTRHQGDELDVARLRQQPENAGQHEVAGHDAYDVAVPYEGGLGPPAGRRVVDEVVVKERSRMQQLHGHTHGGRVTASTADQGRSEVGKRRPEALPTGADELVADGLDEGDIRPEFRRQRSLELLQLCFDKLDHQPVNTSWSGPGVCRK